MLLGCAALDDLFDGRHADNAAPALIAEEVGSAPARGAFLYEPGTVLDFALEVSERDVAALGSDPRTPVPGTFTWGSESYPVSVHLKGNESFRDFAGKPSLKVDFQEQAGDTSFHGVRRLTLNNMVQDGSMLAEAGAYGFYAAMGLAAPRHGYARLIINGEPYGLYGIVETPDEQFLDRFVSDEGNLYSGGYGGDVSIGNAENFDLEEAGDAGAPFADLEALCEAMDRPTDWWEALNEHFDRPALLGMWAVEIVSGQGDGYLGWANNFLLYDDVGAGRWVMIPWGADQALRTDMRPDGEWRGNLASACMANPPCAVALRARVDDALDVWQEADIPGLLESEADTIRADCEDDVRTEIPCRYTQDKVLEFAAGRLLQMR
ncbi:MAG: CotH kinase family protein [Pseudomonadota bacterium]|nr:CotH kinase family protein [Pseudomonadota bacterium]